MNESHETISLLGLGAMGLPMARRLSAQGDLVVWNRSAQKTALVPEAYAVDDLRDAAADIVITVLPDLGDVRDVLYDGGLLDVLSARAVSAPRSPIVVVCGTVAPAELRQLADEVARRGVTVVDAPLSGGVQGAAEGRLSIMLGASEPDALRVRNALAPCASVTTRMGETGAGAAAKLCNQVVVAQTVIALSEAFALARATGIDPAALADALGAGLADSEVLRQKRHHWIEESFEPGGTIDYQLKDLRYAEAIAADAGIGLAALSLARERFEFASESGDGALDHTGIYRTVID